MNSQFQLALAPDKAASWMHDSHAILFLLGFGIVAAVLTWIPNRWMRIAGLVCYAVLAVAFGWYVCAIGYWQGDWFLDKAAAPTMHMVLRWGMALLFSALTLIVMPIDTSKSASISWGQFNSLVILSMLSYLACLLVIFLGKSALWAAIALVALPSCYMFMLWGRASVSFSSLLMSIPSSIVATIVGVSVVRQSIAASIIFGIIFNIVFWVGAICMFGSIGSWLGLDKTTETISHGSSGGSSTSFNLREWVNELRNIQKSAW